MEEPRDLRQEEDPGARRGHSFSKEANAGSSRAEIPPSLPLPLSFCPLSPSALLGPAQQEPAVKGWGCSLRAQPPRVQRDSWHWGWGQIRTGYTKNNGYRAKHPSILRSPVTTKLNTLHSTCYPLWMFYKNIFCISKTHLFERSSGLPFSSSFLKNSSVSFMWSLSLWKALLLPCLPPSPSAVRAFAKYVEYGWIFFFF